MYTHEKKKKNKDFILEWPEYEQKKITFKNESYIKKIKINFCIGSNGLIQKL